MSDLQGDRMSDLQVLGGSLLIGAFHLIVMIIVIVIVIVMIILVLVS